MFTPALSRPRVTPRPAAAAGPSSSSRALRLPALAAPLAAPVGLRRAAPPRRRGPALTTRAMADDESPYEVKGWW